MTTNVRDSLCGELATDSRWSFDGMALTGRPFIGFIDDTGFEKIVRVGDFLFMFAGNAGVIATWKTAMNQAFGGTLVDWSSLPVNGMAVSSVVVSTQQVWFELGHEITLYNDQTNASEASFAGTGSFTACGCWKVNKSPQKAVETAKTTDPYTGGSVKYFNFRSGSNNLSADLQLQSLTNEFLKRGTIMYASTKPLVPVAEAAANDKDVAELISKVQAGEIQASAPCDAVFNSWPDAERKKLVEAMQKAFPPK